MRTWTSLLLALAMALSLAACGGDPTTQSISHVPESGQNTEEMTDTPLDAGPPAATQSPGETGNGQSREEETNTMESTQRIRFSLDDGSEIIVRLNDNPAADALYEMLPLELSFEDFNRTEKIAYLPEEIPSDGSPDQCDPDVGSLCYYIPWGNLCFFYQDFRASSSLIPLGQVETGAEFLAQLDLASRVSVEAADGET